MAPEVRCEYLELCYYRYGRAANNFNLDSNAGC